MTIRLVELADEVRILELEARKLELENQITHLKSEPFIDEDCIGCAGPCMVVDVAAKLQEEYDECRSDLSMCHEIVRDLDKTIKDFKTIETRETDGLHKIIEGLESEIKTVISDNGIMLTNYRNVVAKLREDIRGLEVELSARKEDSAVLMKVVEIVKNLEYATSHIGCYTRQANSTALNQISHVIEDYLDAPEGPPETPIDEPQEITVTVAFLELP